MSESKGQAVVEPESMGVPAVMTEADIVAMVKNLVAENDTLHALVNHYKQVITDMMPNALQVAQLYADHELLKKEFANVTEERDQLGDKLAGKGSVKCDADPQLGCTNCMNCEVVAA